MFNELPAAPPDAILGLSEAFMADPNPNKINLGVGVYKDENGQTPILECVKTAADRFRLAETSKSYLPIVGSPAYAVGVQDLLFGTQHPVVQDARVMTAHTPGGTGGLRVGAGFLKKYRPDATVWVSSPTWANHKGVFGAEGFPTADYRYYDPATKGLAFDAMIDDLRQIPAGDIVLLHVCCHNPTGVDPSPAQWEEIAKVAKEIGWFPFFDFAYQGFGRSLTEDRLPLHTFAALQIEYVVAASFSKNFGLYNERVGSFSLVALDPAEAAAAFSHVKTAIRTNYSNPSRTGAGIVETILADTELRTQWVGELGDMRERIRKIRTDLVAGLAGQGVNRDFSFIERQNGMFSFSGLSDEQVATLRNTYAIYIVKGGRINVAGIQSDKMDYLCKAISAVM